MIKIEIIIECSWNCLWVSEGLITKPNRNIIILVIVYKKVNYEFPVIFVISLKGLNKILNIISRAIVVRFLIPFL